ncbi:hypothetical protein PC39_10157 [Salinisphaera sp. PC39]|uniref:nucleotidyltransferase family protein n=1 Tax=Salinisphaera sp. PC39 TaxID=1304156 RepID=UPI003342CD7B
MVGLLLAAGAGARYGGDKLLARLPDGRTLADASASAMAGVLQRVVAIVRPGDRVLAGVLAEAGCEIRVCRTAEEGMGASLACGVAHTADADGWIVGLADMPLIRRETIARVADLLTGEPRAIAAPVHEGRRGHPVGFGRAHGPDLRALGGDRGARPVLESHRAWLRTFDTDDAGVLADVDTDSDLRRLACMAMTATEEGA